MKVKKIVITLIVITIVCAVIGIVNYVYNNRYTVPDSKTTVTSSKSSNDSTTNPLLAALDVKCYQMEENGKKSVEYITLYKGVESGKLAGTAKKDALKDAVNAYVFHQSIMWYAEKHGLVATDKKVNSYLNSFEKELAKADNGSDIIAVYKAVGLSAKDIMGSESYGTKFQLTYDKVYAQKYKEFTDGKTVTDTDGDWEKFEKSNLKAYLKSDAFNKFEPKLKAAEKAVKADEGI
jgi:hypothetical protein